MLIDLSRMIETGMPVYPGDPQVELDKIKYMARDHYTLHQWKTGLHAGTHMDAPMHLLDDPRKICDFSLERCMAPGVLLSDLDRIPEEEIPLGAAVLFETGMDALYGTEEYYKNHPAVSEELCAYLLSRQVKMVGVDAPSPDHVPFPVHKRLMEMGVPILENLTNLHLLRGEKFTLMAFPLKIAAEGSPVRAVAMTE